MNKEKTPPNIIELINSNKKNSKEDKNKIINNKELRIIVLNLYEELGINESLELLKKNGLFLGEKKIIKDFSFLGKQELNSENPSYAFNSISSLNWSEDNSLNVSINGSYNILEDKIDHGAFNVTTFGLSNNFNEQQKRNFKRYLPALYLRNGKIIECVGGQPEEVKMSKFRKDLIYQMVDVFQSMANFQRENPDCNLGINLKKLK